MDPKDVGSAADEPADISQVVQGGNVAAAPLGKNLTLFSLLKLIAIELHMLNENMNATGNAGE